MCHCGAKSPCYSRREDTERREESDVGRRRYVKLSFGSHFVILQTRAVKFSAFVYVCVGVAALSLFGSSDEDQRDELERKQDEMMLLLKKAKVTGSAPAAALCDRCRADASVCLSSVCPGVSCRLHLASSIRLSYWLIRPRTTRPSSTPTVR